MMMNRFGFKGISSMNMVHRTEDGHELWLGDYYAATDVALLKQKKIDSVLTVAAMLNVHYPKEAAINHKTINAFDVPTFRMTPFFNEAFDFIAGGLTKGNVLVHCAAGISRSTTMVLVYLMRQQGMTLKKGVDYVRSKRAIICPNSGFQNELKKLELQLQVANLNHKNQSQTVKNGSVVENKPTKTLSKSTWNQLQTQKKAVMTFLGNNSLTVQGFSREQPRQPPSRGYSVNHGKTSSYGIYSATNQSRVNKQLMLTKMEPPRIVTFKK